MSRFPLSRTKALLTAGVATATAGALTVTLASGDPEPVRAAPVAATQTIALQSSGDLRKDLDTILADPALKGAKVGVVVRSYGDGKVLYARGGGTPLIPASNQKLATTAAAFGILGAGHKFRTNVMTRAARKGATLRGDLVLKGTGDPTLQAKDYDRLAAQLRAKGVRKVTGRLVADDSWFDARRLPQGWDPSDAPFAYAAQVSALTVSPDADFNAGSIAVEVSPRAAGTPVAVRTVPATGYVKIVNRATTGAAGSASTISVLRKAGTNVIEVTGSQPAGGGSRTSLASVHEPTLYAADVFRRALRARGIAVTGKTVRGAVPKGSRTLVSRTSMPLAKLAVPYMKLSNNNIAEILVKTIGRKTSGKGTWAAGLPAVRRHVSKLGVNTSQLTFADGSGLGRGNRMTADQLVNLLRGIRTKPWFRTYYDSLPIAGKPEPLVGGTLRTRMAGTAAEGNAHAKTGTLTGATALSGYVKDPNGVPVVYSILFNAYPGSITTVRGVQDKIVVRLAAGSSPQRLTVQSNPSQRVPELECSWTGTC
ncbi:D-alanyl-D-alanine carboxypeptidase/D-alanyl-D-alanine-endopeptidase [Actinomadura sp. 6N118]|uniref:D-alanyl-D-alanine carboxypeptidase/D-alanyl-D-alanine endopeptidase n=1 Tax=Actinomadura sp. 6N118 TaxID=3375151 RepID=UPI0037BBBB35